MYKEVCKCFFQEEKKRIKENQEQPPDILLDKNLKPTFTETTF